MIWLVFAVHRDNDAGLCCCEEESTSGRRYEVKMKGEDGRDIPRRMKRVVRSSGLQAMILNMKKRPPWNLIDGML